MHRHYWLRCSLQGRHFTPPKPFLLNKMCLNLGRLWNPELFLLSTVLLTKTCSFIYRYIGPLREEAASWAEKLKEVGEVLEIWLEVQDLWHYLEAVFSNDNTAKVLENPPFGCSIKCSLPPSLAVPSVVHYSLLPFIDHSKF